MQWNALDDFRPEDCTTPDYSANFAANANKAYFADDTGPTRMAQSRPLVFLGALLRPTSCGHLAPRLTARSDTFRIRGYGEVTDADGNIIAKATL